MLCLGVCVGGCEGQRVMHQGVKVGWSVCECVSGCVSEQLEWGICVCVSVNEGVCACVQGVVCVRLLAHVPLCVSVLDVCARVCTCPPVGAGLSSRVCGRVTVGLCILPWLQGSPSSRAFGHPGIPSRGHLHFHALVLLVPTVALF